MPVLIRQGEVASMRSLIRVFEHSGYVVMFLATSLGAVDEASGGMELSHRIQAA